MTETTVACLQMESTVGEPERNIATATHLARKAAANGAHLLILPELCTSGYVLASREEARTLAEPIPDGPACTAFTEIRWGPLTARQRVSAARAV